MESNEQKWSGRDGGRPTATRGRVREKSLFQDG